MTRSRPFPPLVLLCAIALLAPPSAPAAPKGPAPDHAGEVIVRYGDHVAAAGRASTRRAAGVRHRKTLRLESVGPVDVVTVAPGTEAAAARRLQADPRVADAEPNAIFRASRIPNDPLFGDLAGMVRIGAPAAWDQTIGNRDTIVAVVDSGVEPSHPDLVPNAYTNPGESGSGRESNNVDDDGNGFVDDYRGWDFVFGVNDASDNGSHGTHVAGTIAARGDNGVGVVGVSWQSSILPVAVLDGGGGGTAADIAAGLDYAAARGARAVNGSFGGETASPLIRDVLAAHPQTLFVFASGNSGADVDAAPIYPCAFDLPNILCVGASTNDDQLAEFSNYGRTSVDLTAPGVDVLSTIPLNFYERAEGTSMAAPHVTGAAMLVAARYPSAPMNVVRDAITKGVAKVSGLSGAVASGGRLDAPGALAAADPTPPTPPGILSPSGPVSPTGAVAVAWTPATDAETGVAAYDVLANGGVVATRGADARAATPDAPLADGRYALAVRARDGAGNAGDSGAVNLRVDTTPPGAALIVAPRRSRHRPGALRLRWRAAPDAGPIARYELTVDGRARTSVPGDELAGRVRLPRPEGDYTVALSAVDEAGHRGAAATRRVVVDATRPRARLRVRARWAALLSRRGLPVSCRTSEAATCTVSISLRPRDRRRSRARRARIAGPVTLRARGAHRASGRVRLSRRGRVALRRLGRGTRVRIALVAKDTAGNRRVTRRAVRLR